MTQDERIQKQLERQVHKRLVEDRWSWHGTEFGNFGHCGVGNYTAYVRFTATFTRLKVHIDLQESYSLPDEDCVFEGEESIQNAVEWTATKLLELYHKIAARTAPYVAGHNQYLKAVQGINN